MVTEHRRDRIRAATTCFVVILRWLNPAKTPPCATGI
jgi:hypothetical protein